MSDVLLDVRGFRKRFANGVIALDDVNLTIRKRSAVALVGPSGSGKSTLARCIAGFERPDEGIAIFAGGERTKIQMIMQDPGISLNPRFTAEEIIEEPMLIRGIPHTDRRRRVLKLMRSTGLSEAWINKLAGQFSGGQKARLAIARALAMDPALVILDESLSGLDLSVRAQVVNLLNDLQEERGLAYLLITHDRDLAEYFAGEIVIMRKGRIAEGPLPTRLCLSDSLAAASGMPWSS